jgi:LuxR family transcriptional regulator/LuxR family quorum-sensing system transcriptional regulator CciR
VGTSLYEQTIRDSKSARDVWAAVAGYFRGGPADRVAYLHLPPLGAPDAARPRFFAEGFCEDLVARFFEERLFRDTPAIRISSLVVEPVYWDELVAMEIRSDREREFLDKIKAAGVGDGVGIHAYGPNGRHGQFSLGFRPGVRRLAPEALNEAQWICQIAHLRYCALLTPALAPAGELSERESEVLAWVARGKSNVTIADILGISTHTVNAHMRNIYLKLGVFDRVTAAVRGIGSGLIHAET